MVRKTKLKRLHRYGSERINYFSLVLWSGSASGTKPYNQHLHRLPFSDYFVGVCEELNFNTLV